MRSVQVRKMAGSLRKDCVIVRSNSRPLRIKMGSALNRPVEDWGKLLGDSAAVTAMLDRLLHHGHVLKCGPRSWRTKMDLPNQEAKR